MKHDVEIPGALSDPTYPLIMSVTEYVPHAVGTLQGVCHVRIKPKA